MAVIGNGIINSGGQGITKNNFPIVKYKTGESSVSGTYASLQCLNNNFIRALHSNTTGYSTHGSNYFILTSGSPGVQPYILFTSGSVVQSKICRGSSRVIYNINGTYGYYIQILKKFSDSYGSAYYNRNVLAIANSIADRYKKYFWIGSELGNLDSIDIGDIYSIDNDRVIIEAPSILPSGGWQDYMEVGYYIASSNLGNLHAKNSDTETGDSLKKIKIPLIDNTIIEGMHQKGKYASVSFSFLGKYNSNYWFMLDVSDGDASVPKRYRFLYVTSDFDDPDSNNSKFIEINKNGYARYFVTDNCFYLLRQDNDKDNIVIDYYQNPNSIRSYISTIEIPKNSPGNSGKFEIQSVGNSILIEYKTGADISNTTIYSDGNKFYRLSPHAKLKYCQLLNNNKLIYTENSESDGNQNFGFGATRVAVSDIITDSSTSTFNLSDPKYSLNWIQPTPSKCKEIIRYDRPYLNDVLYYRKLKNTYLIKSLLNLSICNKDFQIFCNCSDDSKTGGGGNTISGPCDFYLAESNNYVLMIIETNSLYPYNCYLYIEK